MRRVPGGAGRRGGYGRRQRRQDGEQEASRQSGHESIRAGADEAHLSDVKAACKGSFGRICSEALRHPAPPSTVREMGDERPPDGESRRSAPTAS